MSLCQTEGNPETKPGIRKTITKGNAKRDPYTPFPGVRLTYAMEAIKIHRATDEAENWEAHSPLKRLPNKTSPTILLTREPASTCG